MSGTSIAAPFVTGTLALLWSIFPNSAAADLVGVIKTKSLGNNIHKSIIPRLLDAEAALNLLNFLR
jgi:subtilisin family serine protease